MADGDGSRAAPQPAADVKALDRLVGTWRISGGVEGTSTYEWMEGGFFLIQHVELEQEGRTNKGIEVIGSPAAVRRGAERGHPLALLRHGRQHPRLRLRDRGRHAHDLGRRERVARLLPGHVRRERQLGDRRLGVPGRRLRLHHDEDHVARVAGGGSASAGPPPASPETSRFRMGHRSSAGGMFWFRRKRFPGS
jgi:hypothetical protein